MQAPQQLLTTPAQALAATHQLPQLQAAALASRFQYKRPSPQALLAVAGSAVPVAAVAGARRSSFAVAIAPAVSLAGSVAVAAAGLAVAGAGGPTAW